MAGIRTMRVLLSCVRGKGMARLIYGGILAVFLTGMASMALADPAQDCQQTKDPKLQVQGCTQILNQSPPASAQAAARFLRGWAYVRLGQYDTAITDLTESIRIHPDTNAYGFRGLAYQGQQHYDLAIADFNQVLHLTPDAVEAYQERGKCFLAKGDSADAIADFSALIQKKPDLAEGYILRARAHELAKQNDAAIADLTDGMKIDPLNKPVALFYRALANEAKGQTDSAEADFKNAIVLDPRLAMERRWVEYLRSIQIDGDYANWADKPYDLYLRVGWVPHLPRAIAG